MDVVYARCCGLELHTQTVVAWLILPGSSRKTQKAIRTFGTMTDALLALADWLAEHQVTHVALASTGVDWQPIWNRLEDRFERLLVNAQHRKAVPGRKTDVADREWIADLPRHGLLKASFVPDRPRRELRELTRYRAALLQARAAEVTRLQQTLEGATSKLAAVATDVLGTSGREILAALAPLAKGRLREKIPRVERALPGRVGPHQRFLVARHLAQIDAFDETVTQLSAERAESGCARLTTTWRGSPPSPGSAAEQPR